MKYQFFLNQEKDEQGRLVGFFGYKPGHALELAHVGTLESDFIAAANELFEMFNVNHPIDYCNRSMSVGDVLVLTNSDGIVLALAVAPVGFVEIDTLTVLTSIALPEPVILRKRVANASN